MKLKIIKITVLALTLVSLLILILFWAGKAFSDDPPIETVTIYDKERYMQFNSYVTDAMKRDFPPMLPQTISEQAKITNYAYSYRCAVFGDPTFSIILELKYADSSVFASELERLNFMKNNSTKIADSLGERLLYTDNSIVSITKYLDEEVFDGMSFRISCAEIDEEDMTITYCIASLWDGCICEETAKQFLISIVQNYQQ